jgi:alpha-mannosidase
VQITLAQDGQRENVFCGSEEGSEFMTVGLRFRLLCALLFAGVAILSLYEAEAQNAVDADTVFRIGKFDRSSGDFAPGVPNHGVNFIVSQSDPAKDWFGIHRAMLASGKSQGSDFASAPRTITFFVGATESVDYQLHVALLLETASVPAFKIGINGKEGLFYLHPKLDYSDGDAWDNFDPAYSSADVEFTFPARYWKRGKNTITLQPVEEADEAVPDVGVSYDAIELARVPRAVPFRGIRAEIIPTIYYQ